jgi:putative phosphoesterase
MIPAYLHYNRPVAVKIGLIGDIHANLPALERVLEHARLQEVEAIWNVGDFVGYGAFPDEVVKRLSRENAISIIGNYDLKVLKFKKKVEKWLTTKKPEKWFAFKWAYENLSKGSREYLRSLPKEMRFELSGRQFLMTHGSPESNEEPLTPDTPQVRLRELAKVGSADVIVCGHSHQPFVRCEDGVWFVNTGSVGRPDDGDPRTCYAVLQLGPHELHVQHFRLEYDLERAIEAIHTRGLPEVFAQMLILGRDLETVVEIKEKDL